MKKVVGILGLWRFKVHMTAAVSPNAHVNPKQRDGFAPASLQIRARMLAIHATRGLVVMALLLSLWLVPSSGCADEFLRCALPSSSQADFQRSLQLSLHALSADGPTPNIVVRELPEANAYSLVERNTVVISVALYGLIMSSTEELFMLAHEMGHLRGGSPEPVVQALYGSANSNAEIAADAYATRQIKHLNLDLEAGIRLLGRLAEPKTTGGLPTAIRETRVEALKQFLANFNPPAAPRSSN
ncbi:MAG: hypothetical protein EBZ48_01925 [Proteobacteria bacterium]|nr:hypothetical protein [Pseudomonadota bacterium]